MDCSSDNYWNSPVHPAIHRLVGKHKRMELQHKPLIYDFTAAHGIFKKQKRIAVTYRLQMILERLCAIVIPESANAVSLNVSVLPSIAVDAWV